MTEQHGRGFANRKFASRGRKAERFGQNVTINGTQAGEVSYRMTSNRFDWRGVVNYKPASPGLIIPEEKE